MDVVTVRYVVSALGAIGGLSVIGTVLLEALGHPAPQSLGTLAIACATAIPALIVQVKGSPPGPVKPADGPGTAKAGPGGASTNSALPGGTTVPTG